MAQPQRIEASAVTKKFSGEQLYRGIFFFEGEAGKKMHPEIFKEVGKEQRKSEVKQFVDKNIAYVKNQDPHYFKKLEQAVYSKKPKQMFDLIEKASHYFTDYLLENKLQIDDFKESNDLSEGKGAVFFAPLAVYAVGGVTTVLVVSHGAAITAGVAIYGYKYVVNKENDLSRKGISNYELENEIDKICRTF